MPLPTRCLTAAALIAVCSLPSLAQSTYTWIGTGTGAGANWPTATDWDLGVAPGSNLNGTAALTDEVIIRNNLAGTAAQTIRLAANAGTVASLEIGGIGSGGSTGTTQLQLRGAGQRLIVSGNVILGSTFGGGQRAGQINFGNNNSLMTVNGHIISGSTSNGNNININQGATSKLTLFGDIDSATARGGTSDQEIDLIISRNEGLVLAGAVQELNVESFFIGNTGANYGTITQTIGTDKTVNGLGEGRIGSVVNNNRTANATLAVDGGTVNYTNNLVVGRTQGNGTSNDTANATGNLNVGGASAGNVTVGGELILGQQLGATGTNAQQATGNVTVATTGSVLNLNGGVNMGATVQAGGTTTASITVNGGTLNLSGGITDGAGASTLTVTSGELALLDALGGTRNVDTLSHTGTGVMDYTIAGFATVATTDTALSATAGGSVFDITTAAPGTTVSTADQNTWVGGTPGGAPDGEWATGNGTNWNSGVNPDGSFGSIDAGESFMLVTSTNAITGDAGAAALTGGATGAGWSIAQNTNDVTVTAASAIAGGIGVAHFNDGAADVTRTSDLNIEAAAGTGADASQIDIDDVNTLALTGASNLNLGGAAAAGIVNQGSIGGSAAGGMAVSVGGSVVLADGSEYRLNEGTLAVGGMSLTGSALDGELIINSATANSFTSTGAVTVDHLRVGQDTTSNASITIDYALTSRAVDIAEDGAAQGAVTIEAGGSLTTSARLYIAGDATNNSDDQTVGSLTLKAGGSLSVSGGNFEVGRDGSGTFTVEGGTYTQFTNNLVLGQNGTDPDSAATGTMVVSGGVLNIGEATNAATPSLNINAGGGSVTQTAGDVFIENALNMSDSNTASGANGSSYSISGGTLTVGGILNYRGGTATNTVTISGSSTVDIGGSVLMNTSSTNFLVIDGSAPVSVDIGNDLSVNANGTVRFNLDDSGVQTINVADQLLLNGGTGNIDFDFTGLTLGSALLDNGGLGDIDLIVALGGGDGGAQSLGVQVWGNVAYGDIVQSFGDGSAYRLQEREGSLIVYLEAIPEPGSVLLLALGGLTLGLRRRRS